MQHRVRGAEGAGEMLAVKEVATHDDPSKTQESLEQLEQEVRGQCPFSAGGFKPALPLSGTAAHSLSPPSTQVALLSTLRHPNIVRYVGTLRENRSLYIFLEFVPGGSIASMLARFGRFDETVIRLYTRQILEGLAYLHESRTVRAPTRSRLTCFHHQADAAGRP
jgi:serine/threonine protein kinase